MALSSEAKKEVERLLKDGQKLNAIHYLHETFQISLTDANTLVEVVEQEQMASSPQNEFTPDLPASTTALDGKLKEDVIRLLQANQKLDAVKRVKSELHIGLKEALVMVEEVHQEIDPTQKFTKVGGGCLSGTFTLFLLIFGFIGVSLLGIAGLIYYFQAEEIANSELMKGRVTSFHFSGDSRGSAPVISYQWGGSERFYKSNTFSTPPAYELNEEVDLYVNRNNPKEVVVDTFTDRWLVITIIGGIGFFFTVFTLALVFVSRKLKV